MKTTDLKAIQKAQNDHCRMNAVEDRLKALEAKPVVKFKRLSPYAVIPKYQSAGAAAMDLVAANEEPITIWPDGTMLIPTGLAIELPAGYEAQVRPRSGLALKKGVAVANSPGTIDEDYRGEIGVIIRNHGETFVVHKGERIAQLLIARVAQAELVEVDELSSTDRGAGGFGSTGVK